MLQGTIDPSLGFGAYKVTRRQDRHWTFNITCEGSGKPFALRIAVWVRHALISDSLRTLTARTSRAQVSRAEIMQQLYG